MACRVGSFCPRTQPFFKCPQKLSAEGGPGQIGRACDVNQSSGPSFLRTMSGLLQKFLQTRFAYDAQVEVGFQERQFMPPG